MPYDTLLTCRHFKYVILYMTTTHVLCVYTPMQCALSCICLCHVLVCAGSVLASVLQFFMVLVQQAIAGITFEVLFEVRRHQHISTSTNLRMIFQICTSLSWYFLIIPFFLWRTYCFIFLQLSFFLSSLCCPFSVVLHHFSVLLISPSLPPPPCPSAPY